MLTLDIICLFYAYAKKIENKQTTSKEMPVPFTVYETNLNISPLPALNFSVFRCKGRSR